MPYFRKKPETVEAYRLPQLGEEPSDGLVFFLEDTLVEGELGAPAVYIANQPAAPGEWVVKRADGTVAVLSAEEFAGQYERV